MYIYIYTHIRVSLIQAVHNLAEVVRFTVPNRLSLTETWNEQNWTEETKADQGKAEPSFELHKKIQVKPSSSQWNWVDLGWAVLSRAETGWVQPGIIS